MRPSVPQLLGWQPAGLETDGGALLSRAVEVERAVEQLQRTAAGLRAGWSGAAADAALAHLDRRAQETQALAELLHAAGLALIRTGQNLARAQQSLRAAVATAGAAGCTVTDGGAVTPPPQPSAPAGLTGYPLASWQQQAEQTARQDASTGARLAGLIDAALTAAAAADSAGQSALARLAVPALSPPPTLVRLGLLGGDFGPVGIGPLPPAPLPSCPTTPPPPAPQQDEHGWAYNALGAFGSGAWKVGPGTVGDLVGLVPGGAAQSVDDFADDLYQDMSDRYSADTDSGVYRGVELTTQAGGFLLTGGAAAVRGVPTAVRAGRAATQRVRGADPPGDAGSISFGRSGSAGGKKVMLPTPQVSSRKLQNIVNDLYKGTKNDDRLGDGTTATAIRNELATGQPTKDKFHSIKGKDLRKGLKNWLRDDPDAPREDRIAAQSLMDDLERALRGE